jgi:molybdopterin-biosynthesis enzyme MoeA-like protein
LLTRRLREQAVPLRQVAIVPDEVDAIVEAIASARRVARHVITSGGIGPTHDDLTIRSVALCLGRPVERVAALEELVLKHYGPSAPPATRRLAQAPRGSKLIYQDGIWYPALACEGVYLLPGVPQLFRLQLEAIIPLLHATPVHLRCLYLTAGEPEIASALEAVARAMPHVAIGSYPRFDDCDHRVKLTVESSTAGEVEAAVKRLVEALPQGSLLRID